MAALFIAILDLLWWSGTKPAMSEAAGKYRQQGRNYIVEDGDIIFFKFNTPQQPKKK